MQTLEDIISITGDVNAARQIADSIAKRMYTRSGDYIISGIEYLGNKEKDVELTCIGCGKKIHTIMRTSRNKWSELSKTCRECAVKKKESDKRERFDSKVGETYGDFRIVDFDLRSMAYRVKCIECGHEAEWDAYALANGMRKDFKCHSHYCYPVKYDDSYIGKRNNLLTVKAITRGKNNRKLFLCQCDCGNETLVEPALWANGSVKSCGCLAKDRVLLHTEELDRLRRIYNGMVQRCYNSNAKSYKWYGGRGITVCDEWLYDRSNFIEWALSNGYSNELTIDRIDVDGNYEPGNCRWATYKEQAANKRPSAGNNHKPSIEFRGEMYFAKDLFDLFNTSGCAVRYRMKKMGMTFEEALTTEKRCAGRPRCKSVNTTRQ